MRLALSAEDVVAMVRVTDGDEARLRALFDLMASWKAAPLVSEHPQATVVGGLHVNAWEPKHFVTSGDMLESAFPKKRV